MSSSQVLIFGVGGSGTTAIYNLLQETLSDVYPDGIDFVYEPFLWDRKTFNKRYTKIKDEFTEASSLSFDAIRADRDVPLWRI